MSMLSAIKDSEARQAVRSKLVFRDHTFNSVLEREAWIFLDDFLEFELSQATRKATVAVVFFIDHFVASNLDVLGIDDDNVITIVDMWGISNFAFAHELVSNDDGEFAEWHAASVNQPPFACGVGWLLTVSFCHAFHLFPLLLISVDLFREINIIDEADSTHFGIVAFAEAGALNAQVAGIAFDLWGDDVHEQISGFDVV